MQYRQDIDGLRALAVLPVLFFHAGFDFFSGGFVGVDIFFVISGFLITSILFKENKTGNFSIANFYERRFRRILPALFLVVLITFAMGYMLLLPDEFVDLAESSIATMSFIPNAYFWASTGYFAVDALSTPLLHTWSLGVEEQFYVFFPIFLYVGFRYFNELVVKKVLFVVLFSSLILCITLVYFKPSFSFYMLPTRAWELLMGSVLAVNAFPRIKNSNTNEILSLTGFAMIGYSIFIYTENTIFPGITALLPVFGTFLIIYSGTGYEPMVNRMLSSRPTVFVGLISYSLYLWHWPIVVYSQMISDSRLLPYIVVIISFISACLTYRFVEIPFRKKTFLNSQAKIFKTSLVATGLVLSLSIIIITTNGMDFRFSHDVLKIANVDNYLHKNRHCHFKTKEQILDQDYCLFGDVNIPPTFAIIGDSHGDALRPAFEFIAKEKGIVGVQLTSSGCRPLKGVFEPDTTRCREYMDAALSVVKNLGSVKRVFITGFWSVSYYGESYRNKNNFILDDESNGFDINGLDLDENKDVFIRGLNRFVKTVLSSNKEVIIIGDVPELQGDPRKIYARQSHLGIKSDELHFNTNDKMTPVLQKYVKSLRDKRVSFINISSQICPEQYCNFKRGNTLLFRDGDHLSETGAIYFSYLFDSFLD